MALLSVVGAKKYFGGVAAVDNISVDVRDGQIVGLIGPNGAGKSTLFSLISGSRPVDAGNIYFEGRDVTRWTEREAVLAGVSRTFQLMQVFGSMTTFENVMAAAYLHERSTKKADARTQQILSQVGLTPVADVAASNLTVAWKKRLEVGRALATQPKVLMLDEVLSGLTPTEAVEAIRLVRSLRDGGLSIIMVEHVMEVVMSLCDHVVVIHNGKNLFEGTPAAVVKDQSVIDAYLGIAQC